MKKLYKRFLTSLLMSLFCFAGVHAQLSSLDNGGVYHFTCGGTTSVSLGASALTDVAAVSTDTSNKSQQWYVTATTSGTTTTYTFRNLANGKYLAGAGTSSSWSLTDASSATSNSFTLSTVNTSYNAIRSSAHSSNTYAFMHKDGYNNIVGWATGSANSQWTITKIDYTAEQLDEVWAAVDELVVADETVATYQSALDAIFSDAACTELNSTYVAMGESAIQSDANYLALPATLQEMVLKILGGDWTEENGVSGKSAWDSEYAKKFRVQMYEPYSVAGEITSYLRINAHANMDNPTGLYANNGDPMYIMVEGEIAEGAELWVAYQKGHGLLQLYNDVQYTQLQSGLNIVPYFNDGSVLWINYVVHTYNSAGTTIAEKFPYKISDFAPLKIHIEGGHINGYYNGIGDYRASDSGTDDLWGDVDNDEDWTYYKDRAPLNGTDGPNRDFAILGHRQILVYEYGSITDNDGNTQNGMAYHLDNITVPDAPYNNSGLYTDYTNMGLDATNGKINIMLEAWDRIMYSQLATMGLLNESTIATMNNMYPRWTAEGTKAEMYNYGDATINGVSTNYRTFCNGLDYSEYFNHHGVSLGAYSGYMSGGWRNCNYHYNTMGSIIGKLAAEAGPTWGPAHEIGHQHQSTFNLNGQTEVTNNLFSNIAVWYMGMATSRYNGSAGSLQSVLEAYNTEGNDAYTNNIWALTHMYYRLWLYYHLAGNNTQFWPRLYELCRQVPIINGSQIDGETSLLRFYQHSCDAAGEDLTEFFRAHGYLEVMENRLVGDYSNATYNQTQEQIDAAIEYVKNKNYPENLAILFINDGTAETTVAHDGETSRALWDANATAEYGSVSDFVSGEVSVETAYTATVSEDGTVTMSGGEGGVGFLILDENGEIIAFSNNSSFTLSDEAAYELATGEVTIAAVAGDSETTEAEVDIAAIQASLLSELISKSQAIVDVSDDTYTKVGFYKASVVADLKTALESANSVMESGSGYAAAYEILYAEYQAVLAAEDATVPFSADCIYILTNYAYPERTMIVNGTTANAALNADTTSDDARWQFVATSTANVYNVKSVSGYYCPAITKSAAMTLTTDQSGAGNYILQHMGNGVWVVRVTPTGEFTCFHSASNASYNVVGWSTSSASRWYLTAVEADEDVVAIEELQDLVNSTNDLINEVATIENVANQLALQADPESADYYISCSNLHSGSSVASLLDDDNTTFMHSNYDSISATDDWLDVDLGDGNAISVMKFAEVTRHNASADFPSTIKVYGSNTDSDDTADYTLVTTVTGLPQTKSQTWESDIIYANEEYRYWRFVVTTGTNRIYFHMAEFDMYEVEPVATMLDAYSSVSSDLVTVAYDEVINATVLLNSEDLTTEEVEAAKITLQAAYDALESAKATAESAAMDSEKATLQALIDETNALIESVGYVNSTGTVELNGKLYSNSDSSDDINNLIDNNIETCFIGNSEGTEPYIRVDLGEGNYASKFYFSYTTCNSVTADVLASNGTRDNGTNTYFKTWTSTDYSGLTFASNANNIAYVDDDLAVWSGSSKTSTNTITAPTGCYVYGYSFDCVNNNHSNELAVTAGGNSYKSSTTSQHVEVMGLSGSTAQFTISGTNSGLLLSNFKVILKCTSEVALSSDCAPKTIEVYGGNYNNSSSEIDYSSEPVAIFKATDESNPLPTTLLAPWTSAEINASSSYRYYKFLVTESSNDDASSFALSEFAFTQIGEAVVNDAYQICVTEELLLSTALEVNDSEAMLNIATTASQLQTQTAALQAAYDALYDASTQYDVEAIQAAKEELQALIDETNTLINSMSTNFSDVDLTGKFYSNAAYTAGGTTHSDYSSPETDYNLTDLNTGTIFHSDYSGTDIGNHYMRIDLGEGNEISQFRFNYVTRNNAGSPGYPYEIKVYGGYYDADAAAEVYDETPVATLSKDDAANPLPTSFGGWSSDVITASKAYRYYKFEVTSTQRGYFVFTEFALAQIGDYVLSGDYASAETEYTAANSAISTAEDAMQSATSVDEVEAQATALQTAYDALETAKESAEAAATTSINIDETVTDSWTTDSWKLLWDIPEGVKSVTTQASSTPATWVHYKEFALDVQAAGNLNVDFSTFTSGSTRLEIVGVDLLDADGNVVANDYHFGYKGGAAYNNTYALGVENAGAYTLRYMVSFLDERCTSAGSISLLLENAYDVFKAAYDAAKAVADANRDDVVGYYTATTCENLRTLLASYASYTSETSVAELVAAVAAIEESVAALTMKMPEEGKYYTLRSKYASESLSQTNHYIFANASNVVRYGNAYNSDGADSRYIWQFEDNGDGTYKLRNVHTNSYSPSLTGTGAFSLSTDGTVSLVKYGTTVGAVQIKSGNYYYHANNGAGSDRSLIGWNAGAGGNPIYIEEVEASDISYKVNIDEYKWNTLYLSYPVTIPEDISAYTAYEADGDYIKLTEVSDVIPANTAVFVYSETAADYEFFYSANAAAAAAEGDNLLKGCLWTSAVECLDGYNYYMMLVGSTGAKMYWIYEEYSEDGTIHEGHAQTDDGGYILCNANRAYMPLLSSTAAGTISYRFDFSGATGIDDGVTENRGEDVIFDLNGRRIKEVTAPGIYIVNGKKCYIKNIKNILK